MIDVPGERRSREVDMALKKLFGQRGREILRQTAEECDFQLSQHI